MHARPTISLLCALLASACRRTEITAPPVLELPFGEAVLGDVVVRTELLAAIGHDLHFGVRVRNAGASLIEVRLSAACPLKLLLFATQQRDDPPVWDERRAVLACPAIPADFTLAPGGTGELVRRIPMREFVGDSIGGRRYFFEAVVDIGQATVEMPAGNALIPRR